MTIFQHFASVGNVDISVLQAMESWVGPGNEAKGETEEVKSLELSSQCSATEPGQPDNHQPSQFTAQMVLKCLSCTPGSHSVSTFRILLGTGQKVFSSAKLSANIFVCTGIVH